MKWWHRHSHIMILRHHQGSSRHSYITLHHLATEGWNTIKIQFAPISDVFRQSNRPTSIVGWLGSIGVDTNLSASSCDSWEGCVCWSPGHSKDTCTARTRCGQTCDFSDLRELENFCHTDRTCEVCPTNILYYWAMRNGKDHWILSYSILWCVCVISIIL